MSKHIGIEAALSSALQDVELQDVDLVAVELAYGYARIIDTDPALMPKVGQQLLSVLESLLMTPRARALAAGKGVAANVQSALSPLDELRAKRRSRSG